MKKMKTIAVTRRFRKSYILTLPLLPSLLVMLALFRSAIQSEKTVYMRNRLSGSVSKEYITESHIAYVNSFSTLSKNDSYVLSSLDKNILKGNSIEHVSSNSQYTGIPKIIHQIWKDDMIPETFQKYIKGLVTHNKPTEWKYFWTDETGERFINDVYPSLLRRFLSAREILRADILRLAVIHHYGGVYFGLDTVSVKPLDSYVENHNCSFTTDPPEHFLNYYYNSPTLGKIITNCVLLCKPGNWFIWLVMEQLFNQSEKCTEAIKCTGPGIITEEYLKLQVTNRSNTLPPLEDYQLFTDKLAVKDIEGLLQNFARRY